MSKARARGEEIRQHVLTTYKDKESVIALVKKLRADLSVVEQDATELTRVFTVLSSEKDINFGKRATMMAYNLVASITSDDKELDGLVEHLDGVSFESLKLSSAEIMVDRLEKLNRKKASIEKKLREEFDPDVKKDIQKELDNINRDIANLESRTC
jgi:hypothetical protein